MHSTLAKTQPLDNLAPLAQAKVPLLHVCGSLDPWFKDNTLEVEKRYKKLGGKIQVIVKKGAGTLSSRTRGPGASCELYHPGSHVGKLKEAKNSYAPARMSGLMHGAFGGISPGLGTVVVSSPRRQSVLHQQIRPQISGLRLSLAGLSGALP